MLNDQTIFIKYIVNIKFYSNKNTESQRLTVNLVVFIIPYRTVHYNNRTCY